MSLPPDFRELLEEFEREGVEYVLIGGYAFAFHVQPRATKDLDLLIAGGENLQRASRALERFGAPSRVVDAVRSLGESEIVWLGQPPLRIDLLRSVDGVPTETILRNAIATTWEGLPVRIIALDDLIANKRTSGRPRDLADVEELERVRARRS
jgi:predicted nucleotidyltransferase